MLRLQIHYAMGHETISPKWALRFGSDQSLRLHRNKVRPYAVLERWPAIKLLRFHSRT